MIIRGKEALTVILIFMIIKALTVIIIKNCNVKAGGQLNHWRFITL